MDFLEELNFLMEKYHLNKSTLSKACDIPYTTIDGWYKRGYEGLKLPTLKKLSNYFEISLDYWADETLIEPIPKNIDNSSLTQKELNLIESYRRLSPKVQSIIEQIIDYETTTQKQKESVNKNNP